MKFQDILFFLILGLLIYKQNPRWFVSTGLICLILSIPLFARWVFFTAEHLVWYAVSFFFLAIITYLIQERKLDKNDR